MNYFLISVEYPLTVAVEPFEVEETTPEDYIDKPIFTVGGN